MTCQSLRPRFLALIVLGGTTLLAANARAAVVDGLDVHYKFEETSGTTVDNAAGATDGTNTDVTINQTGIIGQAYLFPSGNDDFIDINFNDDEIIGGTGDFSLSMWINTADPSGATQGTLLGNNTGQTNRFAFKIEPGDASGEAAYFHNGGGGGIGGIDNVFSGEDVVDSTWHQVGLIRDANSIDFIIDGKIVSGGSDTTAAMGMTW